jgi:lysyl-tRNA synthetase class 2
MRDEFLSQHWQRYPVAPVTAPFRGRVHAIIPTATEHVPGWRVTLARGGQLTEQVFERLVFDEGPAAQKALPVQVLREGDLVAISETGVLTLLAPRLQSLPSYSFRPDRLQLWQDFNFWLREFFRERGFVHVATPSLVPCPGTEPSLEPFSTELAVGSHRETKFLPTSPELHLKKALVLGAEKIFEVRSCFRNDEITRHHQPEFTMIEWYRAYEPLEAIREDVRALVQYLVRKMPIPQLTTVPSEVLSVAELFERHCGFRLRPETTFGELKALAETHQISVPAGSSIDDVFFLLFMEKIEAQLDPARMTFVTAYPPYQAALARVSADGWGVRFEMYWQGLEIANAFHELNDPVIQAARFEQDLAKKKAMGKTPVPLDPEFQQSLEAGMPPSSGIALGVERLFMAMTGIGTIAETRLFPLRGP